MVDKMNQNLKTAIKREYVKCVESPQHFMRKYCTIQHPKRGKMKFDLYDYQDDMVNQFKSHRYNIILKSRQLGISTLSAGYSLWMMLFNQDKNILKKKPIGVTTKKNIAPIINGEIILPKKSPNLNQILFKGVKSFAFNNPRKKKLMKLPKTIFLNFRYLLKDIMQLLEKE